MTPPTKPTLEDSAKRNPAVTPVRVRQMQEVVKQLQDRGLLQPSKYGLEPGLAGPPRGISAAQGASHMMNRVQQTG